MIMCIDPYSYYRHALAPVTTKSHSHNKLLFNITSISGAHKHSEVHGTYYILCTPATTCGVAELIFLVGVEILEQISILVLTIKDYTLMDISFMKRT